MRKSITYVAKDGAIFFTEEACKEYEEKLSLKFERILKAVKEIHEVCLHTNCCDCPLIDFDGDCKLQGNSPSQWNF